MKRANLSLALATVLLALSGCSSLASGGGDSDEPEGCGRCEAQVSDLKKKVEQLPQVQKVDRFAYNSDTNAGSGPGISADVLVKNGNTDQVSNAIIKAAWESRITPLEEVTVNTSLDDNVQSYNASFFANNRDEYEAKWGPRPVE